MPLARTHLIGSISGTSGNFGTGAYTSGSFTPPNNSIIAVMVAAIENGGSSTLLTDLTISDSAGLTWTNRVEEDASVTSFPTGVRIWTAPVTTGVSMTVTVDCGTRSIAFYTLDIEAWTGYDTGSPVGAKGTTFKDTGFGSPPDPVTITLDATPATSSDVIGVVGANKSTTGITEGATFTELVDLFNTDWGGSEAEVRGGSASTTADWVDVRPGGGALFNYAACALEIKAAATVASDGGVLGRLIPPGRSPFGEPIPWRGTSSTLANTVTGTATGNVGGLTGTATGTPTVLGTGSGAVGGLTGTAAGTPTVSGIAVGTVGGITGTAAGKPTVLGTAIGTVGGVVGTAVGTPTVSGVGSGTVGGLTGTAVGKRTILAAGAGTVGGLTGAATGTRQTSGTATGTLGGLTGVATGTPTVQGVAAGIVGGLVGVATGTVTAPGVGAGTVGGLTGTGVGTRTVVASATGVVGGLVGSATGSGGEPVTVTGSGSMPLGGLAASADGQTTVNGVATVALGALGVGASGQVTAVGGAMISLGALSASAVGERTTTGVATVNLGALAMSATDVTGGPIILADDFYTPGPCRPYEYVSFCELPLESAAITGYALEAASEIIYYATAQRFDTCQVTLRPCRDTCYDVFPSGWWQYGGGGPRPALIQGQWYNIVCGSCNGGCSCTVIDQIRLPGPVREIAQVTVDGEVLVEGTDYRLDDYRLLVRLGGVLWPLCNNLNLGITEVGTWSVTAIYGEPLPTLGKLAVGELFCDIVADLIGGDCNIPSQVTQLTRQGVTLTYETLQEALESGFEGLKYVDKFIARYNPNQLDARPYMIDMDGPEQRVTGTTIS